MYSVNASKKTEKLKKAYVVGADKKTEKLKKAYVVGADKKLVKLWSSATPQFLITTSRSKVWLSEDLSNWEEVSAGSGNKGCKVAYGNGTYVILYDPHVSNYSTADLQVATSTDGKAWTLRTIGSVVTFAGSAQNIHFCNGQFIATYSNWNPRKYYVYTSKDGVTWTMVGGTTQDLPTTKNLNIVYGYYGGQLCYVTTTGSGLSYSTDLINWTAVSSFSANGHYITHFVTDRDGLIYVLTAEPGVGYINGSSYQHKNTSKYTIFSNAIFNEDTNKIYFVAGSQSNMSTNTLWLYSAPKYGVINEIGYLYASRPLYTKTYAYGNGKHAIVTTFGSSTDKVKCHYSLDDGKTWTEVEIGTVGNTGIDYSNSGLVYAKGE